MVPEVEDTALVNMHGHVFVKIIVNGTNVTLKSRLKVAWKEQGASGIGMGEKTIGLL